MKYTIFSSLIVISIVISISTQRLFAESDPSQSTLMFHGNSFFSQVVQEGPRGTSALSVPNMFMLHLSYPLHERHTLGVEFMGTLERWTTPDAGYPELLQIGEEMKDGQPFLDAQHPHSSPIMGLTFSDTYALADEGDEFKVWIAPRGESGDGPTAFMHRPTGMVNPDAPLGHHIGQDSGHISSTVVGSSLTIGGTTLEASAFHGAEPEPTKVDLPLGELNSFSTRWTQDWTPHFLTRASTAYVKEPEHHDPELDHIWRYSLSAEWDSEWRGWTIHRALIYGLINGYDHAGALSSLTQEFWWQKEKHNIWGRVEILERTPDQLQIQNPSTGPNKGQWVYAFTLGYTQDLMKWNEAEIGLGGSLTKNILPGDYQPAYGGNPLSGKIFIRLSGMKMWEI